MMSAGRRRYVPARQPDVEPVCLLDKEWAARRKEPPDAFLSLARSQEVRDDGATFRFESRPGLWERAGTFIAEEGECCPFFAFEQWGEGGEVLLRIFRPERGERADEIPTSDPSASTPSTSTLRSLQDDKA